MATFTPSYLPVSRAVFEHSITEIAHALASSLQPSDPLSAYALPGSALFFGHLGLVSADAKYQAAAVEAARICGELIAGMPMRPYLYGGVASMAWPLIHLERLGITDDAVDFSAVDDLLIDCVSEDVTPHYDLISGVVGLGVYFLERLPAPAAFEGLRRVIQRLEVTGESDERGLRWFTSAELVPESQQESMPVGKYDLGIAHGVPGVIAFLALALLEGADRKPSEAMLREAVQWLVALERPETDQGAYGVMIDARAPQTPVGRRAAWCYGDPGIAMALLLASKALRDSDLRRKARTLAHRAVVLAEQESGSVADTSLCHGSAGLAHLFGVFGQAFDDEKLRVASSAWHATTMQLRRPGEGVAGFYFTQWDEGNRRRVADSSFLQGTPGVGLSLLSALNAQADRSWDRLLLLS